MKAQGYCYMCAFATRYDAEKRLLSDLWERLHIRCTARKSWFPVLFDRACKQFKSRNQIQINAIEYEIKKVKDGEYFMNIAKERG